MRYYIDIVNICNLRCPSCPQGRRGPEGKKLAYMPVSLLETILDKATPECQVRDISLYNWTEPLLHPELPTMIRSVVERGLHCSISTNLNLRYNFEPLFENDNLWIYISLSGFNQSIYERGHAGGNIERMKEKMEELSPLKNRKDKKVHITVLFHRYKDNYNDELLIKKMALDLGFSFEASPAYFAPVERVLDLFEPDLSLPYSEKEQGVRERLLVLPEETLLLDPTLEKLSCDMLEQMIALDYRGDVYQCCAVYYSERFKICNYMDKSLSEITKLRHSSSVSKKCTAHGIHGYYMKTDSLNQKKHSSFIFDQYQRYKNVAEIIEEIQKDGPLYTVLEVGSHAHSNLEKLLPHNQIHYLDIQIPDHLKDHPAYFQGNGTALPFADDQYDILVAIDVYEHVPRSRRELFLSELCRVSKEGFILAAPFNTPGVFESETRVNDFHKAMYGENFSWLAEHFQYSLPDLEKTTNFLEERIKGNLFTFQHGSLFLWEKLLKMYFLSERKDFLQDPRRIVDSYYNTELYHRDFNKPCYRTFLVSFRDGEKNEFLKEWQRSREAFLTSLDLEKFEEIANNFYSQSASQLSSFLNKKEVFLAVKQQELQRKDLELQRKDLEIDHILNSKSWKITAPLRWIVKLFKNLREGLKVDLLKKALSIWRDQGLKILLKKTIKKIFQKRGKAREIQNFALPPSEGCHKVDVIFFSIVNWDFRYQRPHHLASRFAAEGHRVFYLNIEFISGDTCKVREIRENLYEVFLPSSEKKSLYQFSDAEDFKGGLEEMEKLFRDFSIQEALSIVHFPLWYPLASFLRKKYGTKLIFDCLDEFSGFSNIGQGIFLTEEKLITEADYSFGSAKILKEKLEKKTEKVTLLPNATEFEHFHHLPENKTLQGFSKPIIGYYGAIAEWFDSELVEFLATSRPDWTFVLIGHTFGAALGNLRNLKNVHLLEEKPYSELPKYLYWFDVCTIPFKINELTLSTNPVKFFEYSSSGKPVVSTALPELEPYRDMVYISHSKEAFLENIDRALKEGPESEVIEKRTQVARNNDWDSRYQKMKECIFSTYPLVSIVIVTYNNLHYTKLCIESIYSKTAYPNFEVLVVDNNSTDETPQYLKELEEEHGNLRVILNTDNRGFAAANNQGLQISKGDYLVLLNNDTIVTRGWLHKLTGHLKDPSIGIIGPVTNSIGNEARINVEYQDVSGLEAFAQRYTSANHGKIFDIKVLAFYCVAFSREVLNQVDLLDEQFGVGMFEDDDFCVRVKRAGYRVVCAEDVFIHHFGGASFSKLDREKYQKIFEENKKKYEEKWGIRWEPHRYREGVV